MKRRLAILGGSILLLLGGIGIFLPVLPTTPFVIGAAGLFCWSHPPLYRWLISSPLFGEYIACYREQKGIRWRTKIISLLFLWALLLFSIWRRDSRLLLIVLGIVGLLVTLHIVLLPSARQTTSQETQDL